ncbi:hypothetical protein ABPG75_000742 [Micractinium tetrahymenae]
MATTGLEGAGAGGGGAPTSPRGLTAQDDGSGSYGGPPTAYQFTDQHKPHSPAADYAPHTHAAHLPTGPAVNQHARPISPTDDGTGSYGHPPSVYVGVDDTHKAHRP